MIYFYIYFVNLHPQHSFNKCPRYNMTAFLIAYNPLLYDRQHDHPQHTLSHTHVQMHARGTDTLEPTRFLTENWYMFIETPYVCSLVSTTLIKYWNSIFSEKKSVASCIACRNRNSWLILHFNIIHSYIICIFLCGLCWTNITQTHIYK